MARKLFTSGETVTATKLNDATKPDYDEAVVIDTASASPALRVTQTGSGDALVVEDSANPDATPLVINSVGQIISGATTAFAANAGLQITSDSASAPNSGFVIRRCDSNSNGGVDFHRSRGSAASPSALQANDRIAGINFTGYDGAAFVTGAAIRGECDASPTSGAGAPCRLTFNTLTAGIMSERMRIDSAGNVGIGGTADANAILDLQSTTKGFLPPRMTTTQRNAIAAPIPAGLMVYNTTTNKLNFYNGTAWEAVTSA